MFKFDYTADKLIKEGRIAKNDVYSNIEIDASGFQTKLQEGKVDGLIQEWSGKSWLGGIPAEKLREIMDKIAADLIEFPPVSYEEMTTTISSAISKFVNRKDLQVKLTRKVSNLLTTEAFNLIKVKEAAPSTERTVSQKRTGQNPGEEPKTGNAEGTRFNANAAWEVVESEARKLDGDDREIFHRINEVAELNSGEINPKNIKEIYNVIGGELEARKFLQRLVNLSVLVPVDKNSGKEGDEEAGELPDKVEALDRDDDPIEPDLNKYVDMSDMRRDQDMDFSNNYNTY